MPNAPRLIVDGMNLIGSRPDGWWKDRDGAVRRLIEELERFGSARGHVTAVFDHRPRDVAAGDHGSVTVAFASRRGRNAADDEIVRMVAEEIERESVTVVTSDDELARRVRELGARVESVGSFRRRLEGAGKRT